MTICWKAGPSTTREIHELAFKARGHNLDSVKTLLRRIEVKGWLELDRRGMRPYKWKVLVPRGLGVRTEIDLFLNEVIGTDPESLEMLVEQLAKWPISPSDEEKA